MHTLRKSRLENKWEVGYYAPPTNAKHSTIHEWHVIHVVHGVNLAMQYVSLLNGGDGTIASELVR